MEILPLFVSLQLICYLFWSFNIFGGLLQYPLGDASQISSLQAMFTPTILSGVIGGSILGISLAALLLRQGTFPIYAMLLLGLTCIFPIVSSFLLTVPNTIAALLPEAINPIPGAPNPISVVIVIIVGYAIFWWLFGLIVQRDV